MSDAKLTIVCARADIDPLMVSGSTFEHFCCQCGLRLILAPSSQRVRARTGAALICVDCFAKTNLAILPPTQEQRNEANPIVPNLWKTRN